jgi:hypothetical protein
MMQRRHHVLGEQILLGQISNPSTNATHLNLWSQRILVV